MQISLDEDQVALLAAVAQRRVHSDPRFTKPDFEREPGQPGHRRATQRLQPLKAYRLVELDPDAEPDQWGVRFYRLTALGERVLAQVREQEQSERDRPADGPDAPPAVAGPDR
ncbi:hypothetical protein [Micromonospora aurantiaca (nom. illeg.)]|uniref:hypothetical protein n=1 Tax=Micromonospora aurantiaca (nom. illeg.) TaxID=47850 RepID=UPI001657044F|nr:hypothetical protein [Micromonospora aurantiaca]MBC9006121.1 hypothetical protein [Micromonospora aurantiaca]